MKFLIIRFSSIGDIVLTTPVIRCLKKQVANSVIHFLYKKSFEPVLKHNPYIDKKILYEDNLSETISILKKENYDYVIDLQKNFRSLRIKSALGVKSFSFDKLNFEKWLMVNFKIDRLPRMSIVDRYLDSIKSFGVKNDGAGLDYFISPDDEKVLGDLPPTHKNGYIAWVIGAKHNTKKLPIEKMISIANKIKSPVVFVGGKEDFETGETLGKQNSSLFYNACGKYNLNESAAIVKNSSRVITNDTGLMHIAAAFQKNIISIWGNTIPEFGMYPYFGNQQLNSQSTILEVKNLSCRPCTKIGFEKCPRGHFKCMREIDEDIFIKL